MPLDSFSPFATIFNPDSHQSSGVLDEYGSFATLGTLFLIDSLYTCDTATLNGSLYTCGTF